MEIIIILLLIVINGLFALAEIAIVSSRKSKLQQMANEGSESAAAALKLAKNPNEFLSTTQIGITLIGILAGAFGGATIAQNLSAQFEKSPLLNPYSEILGIAIVVTTITYLSLIIGELVPKRLALGNPEKTAKLVAGPMKYLSNLAHPFVWLLSSSTEFVLKIFKIKESVLPPISEEEVRLLISEGARAGVFETAEKDILERSLLLGDKKVNSLMTPRSEIIWLDITSPVKKLRNKITRKPHSHYPVCRDNIDDVVGILRTKGLLTDYLTGGRFDLKKHTHKPLFIPESMDGLKVLELFKKSGLQMAVVVDEYANVLGLVTLIDILEAIVGDIPTAGQREEKDIIKRSNGTYFVDGQTPLDEFKQHFHIKKLPQDRTGTFHTIGGFVTNFLEKIPVPGDTFETNDLKFEVVDMDGNRVDKILITPIS